MTGLRTLSRAMMLGFVRDHASLFFTILFPLMFLVLFGALFRDQGAEPAEVLQVGPVPVLDQLPAADREQIGDAITLRRVDDLDAALEQVRQDDVEAAIQ